MSDDEAGRGVLYGSHTVPAAAYGLGGGEVPVANLSAGDRARLTVEARCAAVEAAARLHAAGRITGSPTLQTAVDLEAWILR